MPQRKPPQPARQRLYRLLEVGKRSLGMTEEEFRALLAGCGARALGGVPSRTTMDIAQLHEAVERMRALGFRPRARALTDWRAARVAKITALWCALADAGVVRDRSERAMLHFCARLTGVAELAWASSEGLTACIEALKDWARREGVRGGGS